MKLYRPVGNKTLIPVGMVIFTYTKTNPSTWFGGTWEQLSGGYLYLCSSSTEKTSYTGLGAQAATGNTGSTTLTINQIPKHKHTLKCGYGDGSTGSDALRYQYWASSEQGWKDFLVGESGGGQGHTHTLNSHTHNIATVGFFAWRRTA